MSDRDTIFFNALCEVGKAITGSLKPSVVLEEVVKTVAGALEVKACSVRLLDESRKNLVWGAAHGLSVGYIRKGTVSVKDSGLDRKAITGQWVYIGDARTDENFQYHLEAQSEGIHSVLVVPLMHDDRSMGVMRVYTALVREFDDDEVRFLECAANLSALAIDNARAHEAMDTGVSCDLESLYRMDD